MGDGRKRRWVTPILFIQLYDSHYQITICVHFEIDLYGRWAEK